jgi:hypothetical protein
MPCPTLSCCVSPDEQVRQCLVGRSAHSRTVEGVGRAASVFRPIGGWRDECGAPVDSRSRAPVWPSKPDSTGPNAPENPVLTAKPGFDGQDKPGG